MISLQTRVNFRFISLLIVLFLIQQLSFASIHIPGDHNSSLLHYTEKKPLKPGAPCIAFDIEVEVVEEDDVDHLDSGSNCILTIHYTLIREFHTSALNCRYRQFECPTHWQVDRPLFMLHRSWKTHLSLS